MEKGQKHMRNEAEPKAVAILRLARATRRPVESGFRGRVAVWRKRRPPCRELTWTKVRPSNCKWCCCVIACKWCCCVIACANGRRRDANDEHWRLVHCWHLSSFQTCAGTKVEKRQVKLARTQLEMEAACEFTGSLQHLGRQPPRQGQDHGRGSNPGMLPQGSVWADSMPAQACTSQNNERWETSSIAVQGAKWCAGNLPDTEAKRSWRSSGSCTASGALRSGELRDAKLTWSPAGAAQGNESQSCGIQMGLEGDAESEGLGKEQRTTNQLNDEDKIKGS